MQPWRTDLWVRAGGEGEGETDGESSVGRHIHYGMETDS